MIYDAAHCFGVTYKNDSIFNYGDVSTCSFHSTKLFHSGEGGAVFCKDASLLNRLFYHHNFGHKGKEDFQGIGINAKMSELQAALGLAVLPYIDQIMTSRHEAVAYYNQLFENTLIKRIKIRRETNWNYSYYPIVFDKESQLLTVVKALNSQDIYPRRYFRPSLETLPYVKASVLLQSTSISKRVLCLPLFHDITYDSIQKITDIIKAHI